MATQHEGGRDDNGNTGNWNDEHGGEARAQPGGAGRTTHEDTVQFGYGDGVSHANNDPGDTVHEAWRFRQVGQIDSALAMLGGMDMSGAETCRTRWAFTEWKQPVRRRFGDRGALN